MGRKMIFKSKVGFSNAATTCWKSLLSPTCPHSQGSNPTSFRDSPDAASQPWSTGPCPPSLLQHYRPCIVPGLGLLSISEPQINVCYRPRQLDINKC